MSQTFTDVSANQVKELVEQIKDHNPDRTLCLSKFTKVQVFGPTKSKKSHRFKIEVEIPVEAIIGDRALTQFGGLVMLDIATNRIHPKYLREESE
jgi:hypothetical protein